jgi:hypothetical protein
MVQDVRREDSQTGVSVGEIGAATKAAGSNHFSSVVLSDLPTAAARLPAHAVLATSRDMPTVMARRCGRSRPAFTRRSAIGEAVGAAQYRLPFERQLVTEAEGETVRHGIPRAFQTRTSAHGGVLVFQWL